MFANNVCKLFASECASWIKFKDKSYVSRIRSWHSVYNST